MSIQPNQKIILFAGAGMVKPLGLPTVTDFNEMIDNEFINPLEKEFINFIKNYVRENKLNADDIEYLFNAIKQFINETYDISIFILNRKFPGFNPMKNYLENIRKITPDIFNNIKKIVYNSLRNFGIDMAFNFYFELFKDIIEIFNTKNISFITTNYDLTFEHIVFNYFQNFKKLGFNDIDFGFKSFFQTYIYDNQVKEFPENIIEYIKLHGSINWYYQEGFGMICRTIKEIVPDNPDFGAIIYPGFKGVPDIEPFKSLHMKFIKRLQKADFMIAIGFAFRDDIINKAIKNILDNRNDFKIFHINPTPVNKYPPESEVPEFLEEYPEKFVHIPQSVSLENLEDLLNQLLPHLQKQH